MNIVYINFRGSQLKIFIKLSYHFSKLSRLDAETFYLSLEISYRWDHFAVQRLIIFVKRESWQLITD